MLLTSGSRSVYDIRDHDLSHAGFGRPHLDEYDTITDHTNRGVWHTYPVVTLYLPISLFKISLYLFFTFIVIRLTTTSPLYPCMCLSIYTFAVIPFNNTHSVTKDKSNDE